MEAPVHKHFFFSFLVDLRQYGDSFIYFLNILTYLLEKGANPNIINGNGETILDVLKQTTFYNTRVRMLLEEHHAKRAKEILPK